jgi:hypothetical protein
MPEQGEDNSIPKPKLLLFYIILAIFLVEFVIMTILGVIFGEIELREKLLDAILLPSVVYPVVYWFFYKPMVKEIQLRKKQKKISLNI